MYLFCLPHAGGTSRIFKPWRDQLSPDVELIALDVAGRGARQGEPGPATFADAADDLVRIIAERVRGEDYALYGHSMGALLGYEAAHRLVASGEPVPRMLFAAACRPPGHRRSGPMLHTFPDLAFLGALAAFGGVPREVLEDAELVEFCAALIRADYRLYEQHAAVVEPRPLSCPISVIVGGEDPIAPVAGAAGWSLATAATASVLVLEGAGHFFDEREDEVVEHVGRTLAAMGKAVSGRSAAVVAPTPAPAADVLGRLRLADVRLARSGSALSYDAPDGVLDGALVALVAEHKEALLDLIAADGPPEASGPVTAGQRRSISKLEKTTEPAAFNVPIQLSIRGRLDVPALERALTALVARHGALRTRLVRRGAHLVQERIAPVPVRLPPADFGALAAAELDGAVGAWLRRESRAAFRLGEAPLFRASLARLGDDSWELLLVVQHTVSDAWSIATILRDLSALYRGEGDLAPLAADYLDFARWEQGRYQGETLRELSGWWRRRVAEAPLTYQLPYDRPRPAALSGRGGVHSFPVPLPLAAAVRRYADTAGATESAVLFAAFLQWLGDLSGQHDLTIPVNYANRPRREYEDVVGFFVDNLLVRVVLEADEAFDALVRRAGRAMFEAADHFLPFALVTDVLHEAGAAGLETFPQVPFVVLNTPRLAVTVPDAEVEVTLLPTGGSKYEFTFILQPAADGGWRGLVPYQTDLFDADTIRAWCDGFVGVLTRRVVGAAGS